ncbi:GNAT family N-acetyltransferase [Candidatus Dojkabacteria bacterium]|nr:GNAT family N-acetyltransferase [Candidatus Dojkabacteria bacterium]
MTPEVIEIGQEKYTFDELQAGDIDNLRPVLETWIREEGKILQDEVAETIDRMTSSVEQQRNSSFHFVVVRDSTAKAVGCAGLRNPEDRMLKYTTVEEDGIPGELINVFLANEMRGKGLGAKLFEVVCQKGLELGYTELVWNSGPRYEHTAWGFYNKIAGEPMEVAIDFYDLGCHAPVWRVSLN